MFACCAVACCPTEWASEVGGGEGPCAWDGNRSNLPLGALRLYELASAPTTMDVAHQANANAIRHAMQLKAAPVARSSDDDEAREPLFSPQHALPAPSCTAVRLLQGRSNWLAVTCEGGKRRPVELGCLSLSGEELGLDLAQIASPGCGGNSFSPSLSTKPCFRSDELVLTLFAPPQVLAEPSRCSSTALDSSR